MESNILVSSFTLGVTNKTFFEVTNTDVHGFLVLGDPTFIYITTPGSKNSLYHETFKKYKESILILSAASIAQEKHNGI